jgi:uncharacterized protein YyaL (SSP411 family)
MLNLLRLSHLTGGPNLEEKANAIANAFADTVSSQPLGHTMSSLRWTMPLALLMRLPLSEVLKIKEL